MRMLGVRRRFIVVISLTLATAAAHAQQTVLTRGAELLAPFKRDLQEALRLGLAEGPVEAIAACQLKAPEIAGELYPLDQAVGFRVGDLRGVFWVVFPAVHLSPLADF